MVCAEKDQLVALVLHSSPDDTQAAIFGRIWRKNDRKLVSIYPQEDAQKINWEECAEIAGHCSSNAVRKLG